MTMLQVRIPPPISYSSSFTLPLHLLSDLTLLSALTPLSLPHRLSSARCLRSQYLWLQSNQFSGAIPADIKRLQVMIPLRTTT